MHVYFKDLQVGRDFLSIRSAANSSNLMAYR